jgi:hypothetical protein
MRFRSPPKLGPDTELDFSEFHPLDHSLIGCRGYPGGRRRHLAYRWDFQWSHALRAKTLCRVGRHNPTQWWQSASWDPETKTRTELPESLTWTGCRDCYKRLSEKQPG